MFYHTSVDSLKFLKRRMYVNLMLIQPCLPTTIDTLKEYKDNAGPNLDNVLATIVRQSAHTSSKVTTVGRVVLSHPCRPSCYATTRQSGLVQLLFSWPHCVHLSQHDTTILCTCSA